MKGQRGADASSGFEAAFRNAESSKGARKKESEGSDFRAFLDKPEFVQFLDRADLDVEDVDPGTPEGRAAFARVREQFELGKNSAPEIKRLFSERIKEDLDITFAPAEMAEVDEYVQEMAVRDPEALRSLMDSISEYRALEARIGSKELVMDGLVADHGGMRSLKERSSWMNVARKKGWQRAPVIGRFFKPSDMQQKSREWLSQDYGITLDDIDTERERVQNILNASEELERLKEARAEVFSELGPAQAIFEKARTKAQERLKTMFSERTKMEEWEKALQYLDTLKAKSERAPVDYLEGFEYSSDDGDDSEILDAQKFEEKLTERIDQKVGELIANALRAGATYSKFERGLQALVKKEAIGRRSGTEKKDFISRTLRDQLQGASNAKRVFIRTFLASFERE